MTDRGQFLTGHGQFLNKPIFEDDGGLPFKLFRQLAFLTPLMGGYSTGCIVVPAGFLTDLASIPRLFWRVLPQVGKYDAAAVVHDFLYQRPADTGRPVEVGGAFTRAEADRVLFDAMVALGVAPWQRWAIYLAVRIGGWVVWNRYRAHEPAASV